MVNIFTGDDLQRGVRKNFKINDKVSFQMKKIERLEWNNFESKSLSIFLMGDGFEDKENISIILDSGKIDGDLMIDGFNHEVDVLDINCEVSGKINIFNVQARKIKINGAALSLKIERCLEVKDMILSTEVRKSISVHSFQGLTDSRLLINGSAKLLSLKLIKVSDLSIPTALFEEVRGDSIEADQFNFPTKLMEGKEVVLIEGVSVKILRLKSPRGNFEVENLEISSIIS